MNNKILRQLFDCYIEKFEFLNDRNNREYYKWEAVQDFQSVWNLDAADFPAMLKAAEKATCNLIDSTQRPFDGLVAMATQNGESGRIREMFRALYTDDAGDLTLRQQKIDAFLRDCDELLEKHYPGSHLYKNDQRTAMAYLWFHDPEGHYYCKTSEAGYFAKCVEFYDHWGTYDNFNLEVFYRFCDELVAAIKDYPPLLNTHMSRYENAEKTMHPDVNYHILLVDLIFCCQRYNLYTGAEIAQRSPAEVKLFLERKEKAADLLQAVENAAADLRDYHAGREALIQMLESGAAVKHKTLGAAQYTGLDRDYFTFSVNGTEKKFMAPSFADGFLLIDSPAFQETISKYGKALKLESKVRQRLENAKKALAPYEEYLE